MKLLSVLSLIIILACTGTVHSQDKIDLKSVWSGSLSGEGLYQSGNTRKFYIHSRGEIIRADDILETILFAGFGYGENRGRKDDNEITGSFTADLFYKNKFSPFILQYLNYNFAKGIDLRSQTGAGVKYIPVENQNHRTSISLALIYDNQKLASKPGNYDQENIRLSFRFKTKQKLIEERLMLNLTAFYQPVVNNFSRSNFRVETGLSAPLIKGFSLLANYLYTFEDVVSVGRMRADNKLTFGLIVSFGQ
ncbi:MAG: DUF481 domain-containing protein [Ignavibacteria bacterium]|nr:DUF481 domain-containing protein [Ignavibacteria bacterium]